MYILSKDITYLHTPVRLSRNAQKIIFKVPARIQPVYENYGMNCVWIPKNWITYLPLRRK